MKSSTLLADGGVWGNVVEQGTSWKLSSEGPPWVDAQNQNVDMELIPMLEGQGGKQNENIPNKLMVAWAATHPAPHSHCQSPTF